MKTTGFNLQSITVNTSSALNIPANNNLQNVVIKELNGNAVIISIGTTAGGSDILNSYPMRANALNTITQQQLGISVSDTGIPIYVSSPNWNGASLNLTFNIQGY